MINGFLLIDKERGLNSFKLVLALRKKFNQKAVGFAGTLDPLADGLMIFALGNYTKLLPYLEKEDKVYEVEMEFGKRSDTYDLEGKITETEISSFKRPKLLELNKLIDQKFKGEISQIPPRFSAVKIAGVKAYKSARSGKEIDMPSRKIFIHDIEILEFDFPLLKLKVHCSSGTYIRSLVHDLGNLTGCGAVVTKLKRTKIADFDLKQALKLEDINLESLIPARNFLKNLPNIDLTEEQYQILAKGNFIDNKIFADWKKNFSADLPILAFFNEKTVGIIELTDEGRKLKFRRKFNII